MFLARTSRSIKNLALEFMFNHTKDSESLQARLLIHLRESASKEMFRHFGGEIAYGPFKGTKILESVTWGGAAASGSKILGLYEANVLKLIAALPSDIDTLVDVGAADGYYAVGMLKANIVKRAICFESDSKSQTEMDTTAKVNEVRDKIEVYGKADISYLSHLQIQNFSSVIFIFDVEGFEYELLTDSNLSAMAKSHIIVELHEFTSDAILAANLLISRASTIFEVEIIHQSSIDIRDKYFDSLKDNTRALIASEGRQSRMRWIYLTPKTARS